MIRQDERKSYGEERYQLFGRIDEDDAEAAQHAARYTRMVRKRLGLTQQELAQRINVSLDTIRNWEQGKRVPTGAAKALLKILDRSPETALAALQ